MNHLENRKDRQISAEFRPFGAKSGAGVTLIELLVVIGIISLLFTMIIVSLRNAQARAKDARIQTSLFQVRSVAELNYTVTRDYDSICDESDRTLSNSGNSGIIEEDVKNQNGGQNVTCIESSNKQAYAVSSPLIGRPGKHWCVSSIGMVKERDAAITTSSCSE